jgi:hypothetical protein
MVDLTLRISRALDEDGVAHTEEAGALGPDRMCGRTRQVVRRGHQERAACHQAACRDARVVPDLKMEEYRTTVQPTLLIQSRKFEA